MYYSLNIWKIHTYIYKIYTHCFRKIFQTMKDLASIRVNIRLTLYFDKAQYI